MIAAKCKLFFFFSLTDLGFACCPGACDWCREELHSCRSSHTYVAGLLLSFVSLGG